VTTRVRGIGGEVVAVPESQHSAGGAEKPTVSDTDAEDSGKGYSPRDAIRAFVRVALGHRAWLVGDSGD
jgi:hypothetical protein